MSNLNLVNAIQCLQKDVRQLQESVYCKGFHSKSKNAEIKVGTDSTTIRSNTVAVKDENGDSALTSQSLFVDGVDILKTLATLLIPATPICLISYLNNPVNVDAPGQLFIKDFLYWYVCYNFSETNIPIQADKNATYLTNYFKFNRGDTIKLEVSGYIPYASYVSFTIYDRLTGNPIIVITGEDIPVTKNSKNPFVKGNNVYTSLDSRKFSFTIGTTEENDFIFNSEYDGFVMVHRIYGAYKYCPIGLPNSLDDSAFPNDPSTIPINLISNTSTVNNPSWIFSINNVVQPVETNKQPPPIIGHLLTRPVPNKKFPNPFYRLSTVEIPYGDGSPFTGKTNYLASFIEIGKEKGYQFTMRLPAVFDTNDVTVNTKYGVYDVAYISVSVYSYQPLRNYSISSDIMLKYNTSNIYLIPNDDFTDGLKNGKIKGNILDPTTDPKIVLPFHAGQQNIIIIRYKNINPGFKDSVETVPVSNITITGSLTNPEKYIANQSELGIYLPTLKELNVPLNIKE